MRILLVGGGGREHALAWKISQSPLVTELFRPISQYRMLVYGLVLVLVMVLRPEGIMGTNELTKDYIKGIFSRRKKITAADGGVR